jgi:hypothetical protein
MARSCRTRLLDHRLVKLRAKPASRSTSAFGLNQANVLAMPIPRTANPLLVVVSTD